MIVTEETKSVAQGILDYFILYPERHKQAMWIADNNSGDYFFRGGRDAVSEENLCDTTLCVAGSAVYVSQGVEGLNAIGSEPAPNWEHYGAEALGLDEIEGGYLFFCWDEEKAIDAVRAIAAGDVDKFHSVMGLTDSE